MDLPALTLFDDAGGDLPHVGLRPVVVFARAGTMRFVYEVPVDERPEVHVGVAPAHVQALHDLVGAEGPLCAIKQGVDLRHGAVDPPRRCHLPPQGDKPVDRDPGLRAAVKVQGIQSGRLRGWHGGLAL
jgi:hypothetical protein